MKRRPVEERFWENVKKDPGHPKGCWEWQGRRVKEYGALTDKRMWLAHRWAYAHLVGPIPEGMDVLHTCDNPICVNPAHLWLGTHQDNMDDKVRKGRASRMPGVANPVAKLTDDEVREIRRLGELKVKQRTIAKQFGVTQTLVWMVIHRKVWQHVA